MDRDEEDQVFLCGWSLCVHTVWSRLKGLLCCGGGLGLGCALSDLVNVKRLNICDETTQCFNLCQHYST